MKVDLSKICIIHYEISGYCVSPFDGELSSYGGYKYRYTAKQSALDAGYTHQWDGKRVRKLSVKS